MIEHPIPQNVTSYQFHLVGDMTLKQFLELAGGLALAWVVWKLGLPDVVKIPLAAITALLGFGLAFLPIEDRPLDQWLLSFVHAIYRPTIFFWKKAVGEDILHFTPRTPDKKEILASAMKNPTGKLQTLLQVYQQQLPEGPPDPLEMPWVSRQKTIHDMFETVVVPKKLRQETTFPKKIDQGPERPAMNATIHPLNPPENPTAVLRGEITLPLRVVKIPPEVSISARPDVSQPPMSRTSASFPPVVSAVPPQASPTSKTKPVRTQSDMSTTTPTAASVILPPAPTYPNMLSGIIFGKNGLVIENAIIEIRDSNNLPIRVVKTNQLGQFMVMTPLPNGTYELDIEKEGESFDILRIDANGNVMAPIEIRAK